MRNTAGARFLAESAIWRANEKEKEESPLRRESPEDRARGDREGSLPEQPRPVNEP